MQTNVELWLISQVKAPLSHTTMLVEIWSQCRLLPILIQVLQRLFLPLSSIGLHTSLTTSDLSLSKVANPSVKFSGYESGKQWTRLSIRCRLRAMKLLPRKCDQSLPASLRKSRKREIPITRHQKLIEKYRRIWMPRIGPPSNPVPEWKWLKNK